MPFVANTPESLLGRNDSLNPSLTCRGITSNGRPCRRPISAPKSSNLRPSTPDPREEGLYCWQHKEQASLSAHSSPGPRANATPILEGRSSIDTLADRLGLIELQDKKKKKTTAAAEGGYTNGSTTGSGSYKPVSRPPKKQSKSLVVCCCFSVPIEEVPETRPPRPQPRPVQRTSIPVPPTSKRNSRVHSSSQQRIDGSKTSSRPSRQSTGSQTAQAKDMIPDTLDTATASALMTELSRPHGASEESGFIYMFWLTPVSSASPPVDAARSLLAPPSPARGTRSRRASDVVSQFANQTSASSSKTMMLKIGRAQNVQRRMNQWQRQCGYDIEMLRYYPYLSNASESSGVVPHMTPHCHRVERLVHIELGGMGLRCKKEACEACGRDHREWFEVDATREGIKTVDEVIRRWIKWDESNA
ncbi:meiotically up-regulated gene 113-domain-containing protein [Thelonectria olida]|uniref:Meiotically up-regulated gene 113-domain-containing protein n=1 Tax=Thelonectria olida TaxID=1576542 RepID=A0A9P8W433_9HYPO|nr:meiotically up-regulated gene 113-domain-containing protein [Thelonectria olida]